MAEVYEIIPFELLLLLNKLTVKDYIEVADKKKFKIIEIKEHHKKIKVIFQIILNVKKK